MKARYHSKQIHTLAAAAFVLLFSAASLHAFSGQPPAGYTGVTPGMTCAECHTGSGNGSVTIEFPGDSLTYEPGETYALRVFIQDLAQQRFGYSMTARESGNSSQTAGSWTAGQNSGVYDSGRHIGHFQAPFASGSFSFDVTWTAPAEDVGSVSFYVAGNAANGNFNNGAGDNIYTSTLTINPAPAGGESFWVTAPDAGGGWRNTRLAFNDYAGVGWIWDGAWPWIFTYAHGDGSTGEWVWISEDGGSADGFWGYNTGGGYWFWGHGASGWYYSFASGSPGWIPYHR